MCSQCRRFSWIPPPPPPGYVPRPVPPAADLIDDAFKPFVRKHPVLATLAFLWLVACGANQTLSALRALGLL